MNTLPNLIRAAMDENGLTYREVATAANRQGHQITHSRVYDYATGKTKTYKREVLEAIAVGARIPLDSLLRASGLPRESEPFVLPADATLLTPEEREAVRGVVKTMIQTRKQVMGNAEHPTPIVDDTDEPLPTQAEVLDMAAYRPAEDESDDRERRWADHGEESQDHDDA